MTARSRTSKPQNYMSQIVFLILILQLACSGSIRISTVNSDVQWSEIGGGPYHSNVREGDSDTDMTLLFKLKTNSMVGTTVVIGDNTVFSCTLKGQVQAFNLKNGKRIGRIKIKVSMISAPVYDEQILYFATVGGRYTINAYDTSKGRFLWRKNLGIFESPLTVSNGKLFAANRSGTVFYINKNTGEPIWTYVADSEILSGIIAFDDKVVIGSLGGTITALAISSGKPVWDYETGMNLRATPSSDGKRIFWGTLDNTLLAVDAGTGKELWRFVTKGAIYSIPSVSEDSITFGSNDGNVYSVAIVSGEELWRFDAGTVVNTSCITLGNRVYFGTMNKKIYALDLHSGKQVWEYTVEGRVVANPAYYDGKLIFPVEPRFLYVFGTS